MNTNGLARHYKALTPWERLPLIAAASVRGDEVERDRLARSAPRRDFRVPDYWGLCDGLEELAVVYLLRQLDLAALYGRVAGGLERRPLFHGGKRHGRRRRRLRDGLRMLAYCCATRADGWQLLCAAMHVDPEAVLGGMPGHETVLRMVEEARLAAFGAEEAAAYLRARKEAVPAQGAETPDVGRSNPVDTAEDVAGAMRESLEARLDSRL
jgi:hypothetical protein